MKEAFWRRAEHVWSDIVILSLYYMSGVAFFLLTEPWLHQTRHVGSRALDSLSRGAGYVWGVMALVLVLGAILIHQRTFGLATAIAWVIIRGYDFLSGSNDNWFFTIGLIVYVGLALRGTYWRTITYDRPYSKADHSRTDTHLQ